MSAAHEEPLDVRVGASALRCPFCHDEVALREQRWVACRDCLARHHEACWSETGKCATCACIALVRIEPRESKRAWHGVALIGAILLATVAGIIVDSRRRAWRAEERTALAQALEEKLRSELLSLEKEHEELQRQREALAERFVELRERTADEDAFARIVDLAQRAAIREAPNLEAEARTLLQRPWKDTALKVEAEHYVEWLCTDDRVARAKDAFGLGEGDRAIELLDRAFETRELGPSARSRIEQRRELWSKVVQATNRAELARSRGNFVEAKAEALRVLALEPDEKNAYNRRARALLDAIEGK